jgi:microcystin-dependent protein
MSGIIMLCGQQQLDNQGDPLVGGLVYMLQSGTLIQQSGFRDAALLNAWPNPLQLDASGRVPLIWFADGTIRIRITDRTGIVLFDADQLPVLGSSSGGGGGGGGTGDPNAQYITGDLKLRYGTGVLAGFVRANGLTIGNTGSSATEFADPTAQNLFQYLWNLNDNVDLPVFPSRGASAAADWAATGPWKTIQLPDFRGLVPAGLDDMGNARATRLTNFNFTGPKDAIVLGAAAGRQFIQLTIAQLAAHNHAAFIFDPTHTHGISPSTIRNQASSGANVTGGAIGLALPTDVPASIAAAATGVRVTDGSTLDVTGTQGSSQPIQSVPPMRCITYYVRL